jgi:antitoxin HicB
VIEADEADRHVLEFPDVPEAHTDGATPEEAEAGAVDALIAALGGYVEAGRAVPAPSPARGRPVVALPSLIAAKLALHAALLAAGETRVGLARRLGTPESLVRRLLDLDHRSHIGAVEAALAALGKHLLVEVRDAA